MVDVTGKADTVETFVSLADSASGETIVFPKMLLVNPTVAGGVITDDVSKDAVLNVRFGIYRLE